jgi:hypothetical protein
MNGIKKQLTTAYTPQKNEVAERKNSTVVEMAILFGVMHLLHLYIFSIDVPQVHLI